MAPVQEGDDSVDAPQADYSLARGRSRRSRVDKTGRSAALERLKKSKQSGEKNKYDLINEDDVYEEVDEEEYSKIVRERQEDDWIVDDDGSGYVEDGREIFDEEANEASASSTAKGKSKKASKSKNPNIRAPGSQPKSIKSMFAAAAVKPKKKIENVSLGDDAILGDIMSELHHGPSVSMAPPVKLKRKSAPSGNPFASGIKKAAPKAKTSKPAPVMKMPSMEAKIPAKSDSQESGFESAEMDIGEFDSQEIQEEVRPTQDIKDEDLGDLSQESMDVSGIDFEDDFLPAAPTVQDKKAGEKKNSSVLTELPDFHSNATWEVNKGASDIPVDVVVDSSKLPLITNDDGEQVLRMFWLDAYEDQYKQPGVVYLFGKVWIDSAKTHHLKTKEPVTFIDLYQEFSDAVADKYKIMKYKSLKVEKEYAFDIADIPAQSEYLEVRYPAEHSALPNDLKGDTFSHIFGTTTSSLELFLIERGLKGPRWLDIKLPQLSHPPISWCKVEALVTQPDYIRVLSASPPPPPPLVVMALNLRTVSNPKTHQNEIIGVSCLVHHRFPLDKQAPQPPYQQHFVAISKPSDCIFPYDFKDQVNLPKNKAMRIEMMSSERALLGFLLAKFNKIDPDVIVGHDVFGFDVDVLLHRLSHNKVPHWSRLGRLKKSAMPKLSNTHGSKGAPSSTAVSGRLVCDVKISAKELIRCRSYDLTELVFQVLKGEKRSEIDGDQILSYYNNSAHLLSMVEMTLVDATFIQRLLCELNILPLALQITNICGNIMARTLMGGRAERNEFLLNHAFTEKGFIVPDKVYGKKTNAAVQPVVDPDDEIDHDSGKKTQSQRRKPAYAGGLVLEPKKGFYDTYILLLDFNSLYPSIIQEYNICFTTIGRDTAAKDDEEDAVMECPDPSLEPGILPTEIRKLVQSRRQVKTMMKNPDLSPDLYMQYDIRQKALKLTANSMYGCLGFTHSRFYAKPLAALVTAKGREILMKTKDLVQNMNLDVIYGDTDSIMVNSNSTNMEEVFKLGNKVKTEVNKLYRLLEIDIDGVYKCMLLLKKKKYAALNMVKNGDKYDAVREMKGLDIVRRDWCELAKEAGKFVVDQILSGSSRENVVENIHAKLMEVGELVKGGDVPIDLYYITKSLTKNPEDYPDKKSLPHVQVALRLNSKGGRKLRSGDTVYYVICQDGSNLAPSQRAYHPDELTKREDLKIDTHYYLSHQVHPVVSRLCDPIDGTDSARIAECLGLDASGYRRAATRDDEEDALLGAAQLSEEERFMNCDRLLIKCPKCSRDIVLDSPIAGMKNPLLECPNPQCKLCIADRSHAHVIRNALTVAIRKHIQKYYEGWLHCEDVQCGLRTRNLSLIFAKGIPVCHQCQRGFLITEYTDTMLYDQLCFYRYVLEDKTDSSDSKLSALKSTVDFFLNNSAYSHVNLSKLFQGLFK
ncbi:hypothetical protein CAPTEDRAFT_228337 [Capitella teleta]|uniref:DNA polymerase n=1 Tax=Capitella teleta TaxID=283909 RepID=R7VF06_CAPTE|nr:hypothetical protein CAPTEDRAFT_228337 [Capitella teleta]|eukprot:ELU17443.1 hypothetical protein CAPTEDRAFT_228337 [Capitella teleta]